MKLELFPSIYANEQREKHEKYKREIHSKIDCLTNEKREFYNKKNTIFDAISLPCNDFDGYRNTFLIIFIIIQFLALFVTGISNVVLYDEVWQKIIVIIVSILASIIVGFLLFTITGPIIGVVTYIISPIAYPIYRLIYCFISWIANLIRDTIERSNHNKFTKEIQEFNQAMQNDIKCHRDNIEKNILLYEKEFEEETKRLILHYANSELTKEVIEWLTQKCLKTIQAADRSEHIENITIHFDVHVYSHKIIMFDDSRNETDEEDYDYEEYDFEKHRCENLPNSVSQAAFTRVLAAQVQLNIMMQYENDSSGTEYKIDIEYTNERTACLVYTAPNGNYKSIHHW